MCKITKYKTIGLMILERVLKLSLLTGRDFEKPNSQNIWEPVIGFLVWFSLNNRSYLSRGGFYVILSQHFFLQIRWHRRVVSCSCSCITLDRFPMRQTKQQQEAGRTQNELFQIPNEFFVLQVRNQNPFPMPSPEPSHIIT